MGRKSPALAAESPNHCSREPADGRLTIGCEKWGMETELARYDAACHALAEARSVDEVREILNFAEAQRA